MGQTGNDNLNWHLSSKYGCEVHVSSVDQSIKYNNYVLELWISTELGPGNQCYKAKGRNENIQGKCIPSACVYLEIAPKTVSLASKPSDSRSLKNTLNFVHDILHCLFRKGL